MFNVQCTLILGKSVVSHLTRISDQIFHFSLSFSSEDLKIRRLSGREGGELE